MEIFYKIKQFSILNGRGDFCFGIPSFTQYKFISKRGGIFFLSKNFAISKFITIFASHTVVVLKIIIMKHFLQTNREGGIKLETINRVLSSNTNFVKRLKQSGRSLIPD